MKTIELNLYSFSELSEEAQQTAIRNWKDNTQDYFHEDEYINSLKEFCRLTDIDLKNWSIGPYQHSYINLNYSNDNFDNEDLSGLRLRTWLINNWLPWFRKGKHYSTTGYYDKDKKYHYKHRYSKINFEYTDLTGHCSDYALIDPILDFIDKPDKHIDLNDLIEECMDSFITDFNADMEYQDSDEYIKENIEDNEYIFLKNGMCN